MQSLLSELDAAAQDAQLSELVGWKESGNLPYLDACVKEAGRMHPPFGLPMERVVPAEGAVICGQHFAGGTVVGMSGWVVHRDHATFGEDCDVWRPERWLCVDEEGRKRMEHALLTVGTLSIFELLEMEFLGLQNISLGRDIGRALERTSPTWRCTSLCQQCCECTR